MRIKNWEKFQHYKNRRPPWIKLYRELLDDREFGSLPGEAAKHLVMLWLIASEGDDGELPGIDDLAYRLRTTPQKMTKSIVELYHWVEGDASTLPAHRRQDACSETEGETEGETETEARVRDRSIQEGFDEFWSVYPNRKAKKDAIKAWGQAAKERPPMEDLLRAIRSQCKTDMWQRGMGIPYPASWLRGERWKDEGGVKIAPATGRPIPKCDPIVEDVPETAEEEAERMAAAKAAIDAMKKLGQGMSLPEGEES